MFKRVLLWGVFLCRHYLQFVGGFRWGARDDEMQASLRELHREVFWITGIVHNTLPPDVDYVVILRSGANRIHASNLSDAEIEEMLMQDFSGEPEPAAPDASAAATD